MTLRQYQGCLVGLALGDAVGAPVEMKTSEDIARYIEHSVRTGDFSDIRRHERGTLYSFGQYTDDTQLSRELALSLVHCNGLNMEDWAKRLVAIFESGQVVGSGGSTRAAVAKLGDGVEWQKAGTAAPIAGNGGAMRAAPIGLFYRNLESIIVPAANQCFATHQADEACAGSVAIASATALAIRGTEPVYALKEVAETTGVVHPGFGSLIWELNILLEEGNSEEAILSWIMDIQPKDKWPGITPWVVSSVIWSLYAATVHHNDYMEALITAIKPGGDVDSTASMAGGIVGARMGLDDIAPMVASKINDQGEFGFDYLCYLGELLWNASEEQARA